MALTYFYAEMFGIIVVILGLAMLINRSMMLAAVRETFENRGVLLLAGLMTLVLGLVVVLTHNIWDAGFLASLVSLIGWLMLIKGGALLLLPHSVLQRVYGGQDIVRAWALIAVIVLLVGIYLAWNGFAGTMLPY